MNDAEVCRQARVYLGVLGLTATRVSAAEDVLRDRAVTAQQIEKVREAVMDIAEPNADMRGSIEYKRQAAGALARLAVQAALRRARGEHVEVSHLYA